ncbi:MAG: hypothetical protein JRI68_05265 [Deltaproteobacteria bacterium]|nr:hypothetical protein [Deltaproteobacteria bacterium]
MVRGKRQSRQPTKLMPSIAAAKHAGVLPPHEDPAEVRPLCALVVLARVLERKQWREEKMIRWQWAKRMARGAPPIPDRPTSRVVTRLEDTYETIPCVKCHIKRKRVKTPVTCTGCYVRARILHTADTTTAMFETYLPKQITARSAMFGFESMLERRITPSHKLPPDVLECHDLKPRSSGGAYRAARTKKRPEFHGHDFGSTIQLATKALEKFFLGKEVTRHDVRAWAWPFLWLRYGSPGESVERALFVDPQGKLDVFVGAPPE